MRTRLANMGACVNPMGARMSTRVHEQAHALWQAQRLHCARCLPVRQLEAMSVRQYLGPLAACAATGGPEASKAG